VGLGNIGERYAHTRHNVGFWVVDHLASDVVWQQASSYAWAVFKNDSHLLLIKPTTFMNNSGLAVVDLAEKFDLVPEDILVIVDDIHLDVGRLRFRRGGSHGGHNGLRSIMHELGASDFPRLRVGVGHPPDSQDLIEHVLGAFLPEELDEMDVAKASSGVLCWYASGIETAMNLYN